MKLRGWKPLLIVLLLALGVRGVAALGWHQRSGAAFYFGDSASYWALGQDIAAGRPYRFGPDDAAVFRTPGYPLLLTPIFLAFGQDASPGWGRLENVLLGSAAVAATWWVARLLFDERAALLAGLMAAVYPGAVAMSAFVLTETPFALAMLLQLGAAVAAWRAAASLPESKAGAAATGQNASSNRASAKQVVAWALLCGGLGGVATLIRPSWLVFTPLAAMVLAVTAVWCRGRAARLLLAGTMLVGLILVMTPWWIRNYFVVGRFVPTTLQVGASLYDGLSPRATGASDMQFVGAFRQAEDGVSSDVPLEVRLDRRMRAAAIDWAAAHPGATLQLAGVKLLRMWNVWPNEPAFRSWPVRLVVLVSFVPVVIVGLWGGARTLNAGWPYWLCWMPAVYFTLLHAVFVGSIRYRQPAMFGLMILAAGAIVRVGGKKT